MKFKFIKKVDKAVPVYGGKMANTGDIVDIDQRLVEKAMRDPNYEEVVKERAKKGKNDGDKEPDNS